MKLAIIGAGGIVREFLPDLCTVPGLEIVAIQGTPRSAEKTAQLCQQYGIPHALQSFADVVALRPDAVYIATPNALHYPLARQALAAGLHAIVEKPLAANAAQVQALAAAARQNGVTVWEAITTPYMGSYRKLKSWLPRIGDVKLVQCNFSQRSRKYDAFLAGATPPVFDPAQCGGALMDLNVYNIHFTLGLFGAPQEVRYAAVLERGIDTAGVLTLQYPGFVASLTAAKSCAAPPYFVVEGADGCLQSQRTPNMVGAVTLTLRDGTAETFDDGAAAHRVLPEFTAITAAITAGDTALYRQRFDQSLAAALVLTAARQSAGIRFPAQTDAL